MATDAAAKIITGDFGKWVEITQAIDRETENVERVKNHHNQPDEWPADQEIGFYQDRLTGVICYHTNECWFTSER
jgi:hypothetical protein